MTVKSSYIESLRKISLSISILVALLILFTITTQVVLGQDEENPGINIVDIEEFVTLMNMTENHAMLDVRTWMEYKKGRIPGAIYAGTSEILSAYTASVSFDTPLLLYCATNFRSKTAGRSLAVKGFKNIYILEPGYYGWKDAGKEIDKRRPPASARRLKK